jgi:hypothetical protein
MWDIRLVEFENAVKEELKSASREERKRIMEYLRKRFDALQGYVDGLNDMGR